MSVALPIAVADLVVADFNAATFSQSVVAVRSYFPRYTLEELLTARVTVVPKDSPRARETRGSFQRDVVLDVAVQKQLVAADAAAEQVLADALVLLTEELLEYYETRSPSGTGLAFVDGGYALLWDPDHLNEKHVFTSVMTLTFRKWS